MKRSKYSEREIVGILKRVESGMLISDICREHGISKQTYYVWKNKYGGMGVSDISKLKELEKENAKLKKLYAEMALQNHALKDLIEKKF